MRTIDADRLLTWFDHHYDDEEVTVGFVSGLIKEQPTIEARPKTGEWIEEEDDTYTIHTHCSVCGELAPLICRSNDHGLHLYGKTLKTKYCPNCGSLLLGGEEDG